MHLHKNFHSVDLIILFLIILQVYIGAHGDVVRAGDDNSVEDRDQSDDGDENLIPKDFLDARLGSSDEDTDVARILRLLEAVEREAPTASPTTTTPRPTPTPVPTIPDDSPFFKTERPTNYNSPASKRSDYNHHNHVPSLDRLLWSTGRAAWDVASPFFYATHVGRAVGLAQSTITLPFRTMGAIRKAVNDLTQNPNGQDDQKQSGSSPSGWHQSHGHHHLDHHAISHGWGWKNGPLYIKYEPDNSLFKSWLTYLYRILRPAVATKLKLKRYLLLAQLRYIIRTIREALRAKFRPNVLVLKDAHKGWGHHHDNEEGHHVLHDPHLHYDPLLHHHDPHHHHDHHVDVGWGWNGWKPTTTPKPATSYGPPEYKPPAPISHYEVPAHSAYGSDPYPYKTSSWGWKKRESEKEASSDTSSAEYFKQLGNNLGSMLRFSLKDATAAASILKEMQARKSRETEQQNGEKEVEDVPYLISESES